MYILAIDTSCDDTSVAITRDDVVLANVISSQVALHKQYGGIMPLIAKRAHQQRIEVVLERALHQAKLTEKEIDLFAVTYGPGLAIALEVGVTKAKELALKYNKPLIAVNHMEGHLLASFARGQIEDSRIKTPITIQTVQFPFLALLVSGGHTELLLAKSPGVYELLGETLDDAVGEAFDKVARMLGLGYPGGKLLATLARDGNPKAYPFPLPMTRNADLNFSFSGLKTAALRKVAELTADGTIALTKQQIQDFAACFQAIAVRHLVSRTKKALEQLHARELKPHYLVLGGGVSANKALRSALRTMLRAYHIPLLHPPKLKLCMDNAAMIAVAAYSKYLRGEIVHDIHELHRDPIAELARATQQVSIEKGETHE